MGLRGPGAKPVGEAYWRKQGERTAANEDHLDAVEKALAVTEAELVRALARIRRARRGLK